METEQVIKLRKALTNADISYFEFGVILTNIGKKITDIVINPGNLPEVVEKVMNAADKDGWEYELVKGAIQTRPGNPLLQNFIAEYPSYDPANPPPSPPDPYEAYFVNGNYLFIGRPILRTALKTLRQNNTSRIFVVEGEPVCGKSYTSDLIGHISFESKAYNYIPCDLDEFVHLPRDVIKAIAAKMAISPLEMETIPKPGDEQDTRHIQELCDWLQGQVKRTQDEIWWFIFDGFSEQKFRPETKELIVGLAKRIEKELRDKCCMVLINYQNILPPQMDLKALREKVKMLDNEDLIDFLERLFSDNGKTYAREDFEKAVDEIVSQTKAAIQRDAGGDSEKQTKMQEQWLIYLTEATDKAVTRYMQNGFVL